MLGFEASLWFEMTSIASASECSRAFLRSSATLDDRCSWGTALAKGLMGDWGECWLEVEGVEGGLGADGAETWDGCWWGGGG